MMKPSQSQKDTLLESLRRILDGFEPIPLGEPVQPCDALYAYRLLLGRMPGSAEEIANLIGSSETFREFLGRVLDSPEFSKRFRFLPGGYRVMTEANGFRLWFNSSDREMGGAMAGGTYEPETVGVLRRILQPGMVCVDVGAQIGFFTCLCGHIVGPTGKVFSFEPLSASFELLQKNVSENRFDDRTQLRQVACADKSGKLTVDVRSGMVVASRDGNTSMTAVALDEVIEGGVDFCKIDVEGHEPAVIEGMAGILRKSQPILLTEFNNYWLKEAGSSITDYAALLRSFGYELWTVGQPLARFDEKQKFGILENFNVLAVRADGYSTSGNAPGASV